MPRAFGWRVLLTALTLGCGITSALNVLGVIPGADFPIRLEHLSADRYALQAQAPAPLPSPLRTGDVISVGQLTVSDRAALFTGQDVPPGTVMTLPVERDGRTLELSVPAVADTVSTPSMVEYLIFEITMFAIAILALWYGRDWAAWGLAAFFVAVLLQHGLLQIPAPLPLIYWQHQASEVIRFTVLNPALFVVAYSLAGAGLPTRWRTGARLGMAASVLGLLAWFEVHEIPFMVFGVTLMPVGYGAIAKALLAAGLLLPLLVLLGGYRASEHQQRLRIRWVLWSSALLVGGALIYIWKPHPDAQYRQLANLIQGVGLLGYLYALLRTRLIDVAFVVDRALVFALLTTLVFGTFSALEQGLHQLAVGEKIGWALQGLVALGFAVVLSPLHRRLESWIEQIFFRAQRLAILTLNRFAAECPFVEREAHLLEMAVDRLASHSAAAAIYERAEGGYRLRVSSPDSWPNFIDADDPAFVALRARREPVALAEQTNRLGAEGFVFPMSVGASLLGAVVCRPRDGEQFAPEVRAALAGVAHHLGTAITALRHREHAQLVADLAAGRIEGSAARQRAVRLVEGGTPLRAGPES